MSNESEIIKLMIYTCPIYGGKFAKNNCNRRKEVAKNRAKKPHIAILGQGNEFRRCLDCEGPVLIDS